MLANVTQHCQILKPLFITKLNQNFAFSIMKTSISSLKYKRRFNAVPRIRHRNSVW